LQLVKEVFITKKALSVKDDGQREQAEPAEKEEGLKPLFGPIVGNLSLDEAVNKLIAEKKAAGVPEYMILNGL
jgi:hypothetical protein